MAAKNKYVSTNLNHIYEKTTTTGSNINPAKIPSPASSSSSSYSAASYSAVSSPHKPHGHMLVLTRPNPKPVVAPSFPSSPIQSQQRQHQQPKQTVQHASDQPQPQPGSDVNEISLRPLGQTGTRPSLSSPVLNCEKNVDIPPPPISSKPGKFVPPHLRPGFVPKEEKIGPDVARSRQKGNVGSPGRYGEDTRPKSGGSERMRRGDAFDSGTMRRPISSGSRPGSSGWYVRLHDPPFSCCCVV